MTSTLTKSCNENLECNSDEVEDYSKLDLISELKAQDNLNLPYEKVMENAANDPQVDKIISDPIFWEVKANKDFEISSTDFRNTSLDPINRYLYYYNYTDRYNDALKKSTDPYYLNLIKESYDQLMSEVLNSNTLHLTLSDPTFWFLKANYDFNTTLEDFYNTENPSEYRYLDIQQQL